MSQNKRLLIGGLILIFLIGIVMSVDLLQRQQAASSNQMTPGMVTAAPGSIPITINGEVVAVFIPEALDQLPQSTFQDAEEGKTQEGWLLCDVLKLYLPENFLQDETTILVRSNHRQKEVTLTWKEVENPANKIMFDISGRGTLKLVSLLPRLDSRDEWVQDTDEIAIITQ